MQTYIASLCSTDPLVNDGVEWIIIALLCVALATGIHHSKIPTARVSLFLSSQELHDMFYDMALLVEEQVCSTFSQKSEYFLSRCKCFVHSSLG